MFSLLVTAVYLLLPYLLIIASVPAIAYVLVRKKWFGKNINILWRILFLASLFFGYFAYDQLFRYEREHLFIIGGAPMLFPPWSVYYERYDGSGPRDIIFTYGVFPEFNSWSEILKRSRFGSNDQNYMRIKIHTGREGFRVAENMKKIYGYDDVVKSGTLEEHEENGFYTLRNGRSWYLAPKAQKDEPVFIKCETRSEKNMHKYPNCSANIYWDGLEVEIDFWQEMLPRWNDIYEQLTRYLSWTKERGQQAVSNEKT